MFFFFSLVFLFYVLYLIFLCIFLFIKLTIDFIFSLRKDRIFRKSFIKDLIFYRLFTFNFYETYSQLNLSYIYYPVFYFQSDIFLSTRTQNEEYYDLLDELDALETSLEMSRIQKVVSQRLLTFEYNQYDLFFRYIFHCTNMDNIYSFFLNKDHNVLKHFSKIQDINDFLIKFDKATKSDRIFV